ncbi:glycoside hydrolase superfamily, partial [Geopyxis carbonaria]
RYVGQMIMVIFDGLSVTPDIQMMIEKYHVGNILLTARNIRADAVQVATLTQELQKIAQAAGFNYPLMIGIEQENGMISRLGDGIRATHFPGSMALGATRSPNQAFDIAKATAKELAAVGINWNFAPVLDVISEGGNTNVSVRAYGDDPQLVGRFGVAFAEGLRAGGVGHCAKHFPGTLTESRQRSLFQSKPSDELENPELIPFRRAVAAGLDSVMLSSSIWSGNSAEGGDDNDAERATHVIGEVLRRQLGYDGVTVCDATDMPIAVNDTNKVGEAVVTAIRAGCDIIQIYQNPTVQTQGIEAVYEAIRSKHIQRSQIHRAYSLVMRLKEHYFNWRTALAAPDPQKLPDLMQQHKTISRKAYENSLTIVRDEASLIPLSSRIVPRDEVLLLSPVVRPLHRTAGEPPIDPFECLGRSLAKRHPHIIHAPYTAQGITQTHVALIKRCAAVIFVTCNARRPNARSQVQTATAVHRLCYSKPMINMAVCDPYDLLDDRKFGTYLCTYEYSPTALETAAAVVFGERHAAGVLPVHLPGAPALRQQRHVNPLYSLNCRSWFVEVWEKRRDLWASADLWQDCLGRRWPLDATTLSSLLDRPGYSKHFVVRHKVTQELLGLCATYIIMLGNNKVIGSLALLLVRPTHRDLGIGLSLHDVAVRYLRKTPGISSMQLGSIFPRLFPGLPVDLPADDLSWFGHRGWKLDGNFVYDLFMRIDNFRAADDISTGLANNGITIETCRTEQFESLMDFEEKHFGSYPGWVEKYHSLRGSDDIADALIAYNEHGILGAVIIYSPVGNNQISKDIPWPKVIDERIGGLGFVSVIPESRNLGVRKGLIVAAIIELKSRGLRGCFVDWADDIETYTSLGFQEWGKYREVWRKI